MNDTHERAVPGDSNLYHFYCFMKIICLEENYLDSELGRACMPVALEQAPFLGDWGKTVADGHNPDRLPAFPL